MENKVFYSELRQLILTRYNTMAEFADAIKISSTSLSNKLNKKTPWRLNDITTICEVLEIPKSKVQFYFL